MVILTCHTDLVQSDPTNFIFAFNWANVGATLHA